MSNLVTVNQLGNPRLRMYFCKLAYKGPSLAALNIHSLQGIAPPATAAKLEHVVRFAVQRDLTSELPSTTGTVLPRIPSVALFWDPTFVVVRALDEIVDHRLVPQREQH